MCDRLLLLDWARGAVLGVLLVVVVAILIVLLRIFIFIPSFVIIVTIRLLVQRLTIWLDIRR
jgi:hypothetical protein